LAVFGGSAALALAVSACWRWLAPDGQIALWAWVMFVLVIDVAHVWTTIFRTYLDPQELAKRRLLYLFVPVACYLLGVALHSHSALTFWRVLAYIAVFHFVRQQVGWVAIYRARAGERERIDKWVDDTIVYCATGYPILYWHAHLPRRFAWFVDGDFVALRWLQPLLPIAAMLYGLAALAYVARSVVRVRRGGSLNLGKHCVVLTTALIWFIGIVAVDQDFTFTVTNVTLHGVPYIALLWFYSRERAKETPGSAVARVVGGGIGLFLAIVLLLAFMEEMAWDRLVWHERPELFGKHESWLDDTLLSLVVPLLSLPQVVHYALDGVIWRSKDAGAAQARSLGFA